MEVDHIVSKLKEGTDRESNLQLLCAACNNSRSDRSQAYLDKELERLEITLHRRTKDSSGKKKNRDAILWK